MSVLQLRFHLVVAATLLAGKLVAQPIDSAAIHALDTLRNHELPDLGPFGGSGEGEEPPGYDGWWSSSETNMGGENRFHTGDDLRGYTSEVVFLSISSINGGAIPKFLGNLRNLRVLEIDFQGRLPLPSGIWNLPKLERLVLRPSGNCKLSEDIGKLKNLRQLTLLSTDTLDIPASIGQLTNLERLLINGYAGPRLKADLSLLTHLTYLHLQGLGFQAPPKGLGKLVLLDTLNLEENQLATLPPEIGNLNNLHFLALSSNQLGILPPEIGNLQKLEELLLHGNNLYALPAELGLLVELRLLDLRANHLVLLPESMGQLRDLEFLALDRNQLMQLPTSIGGMGSLKRLDVNDNQLSTLPKGIGELQALRQLYAESNPLQDLPTEVTQLEDLELFRFNKAGLRTSSKEIWQYLNGFGNPIPEPVTEIDGKPLAYYLALPAIDTLSKRYAQGDLALAVGEFIQYIGDSLATTNPETAPFYLHLFSTYWRQEFTTWNYGISKSLYRSEKAAAQLILNHPCLFFQQVKNGPYQDLYEPWQTTVRYELWRGYPKPSELFLALQAGAHTACGDSRDQEIYQFVKDLDPW